MTSPLVSSALLHPPRLVVSGLVQVLHDAGVSYVLVGSAAAQLYGAKRSARDFDLCLRWDEETILRLRVLLQKLNARPVDPLGVVYEDDLIRGTLGKLLIGIWRTALGDIDVKLGLPCNPPGDLKCYGELVRYAVATEIVGTVVHVASLEDMITSLLVTKRPKDEALLAELMRLRVSHRSTTR